MKTFNPAFRAAGSCLVAVIVLGLAFAPVSFARPPAPELERVAVISLRRSSATVDGCGVTRVEIWANEIAALYGIDVRFTFDPSVLQVVDAEPSVSGTQISSVSTFLRPDFVVRRVACNTASAKDPNCQSAGIVWYAATQTAPALPASGSGPLASIDFVGGSAGLSSLQIVHSEPVDIKGVLIPADTDNTQLEVMAPDSPALGATLLDLTTAQLKWTAIMGAGHYRLYLDTGPYFAPADPPYQMTTALSYQDAAAIGDPEVNHFYAVKSGCGAGLLSNESNRVGEFDFALEGGS